MITLIQQREPTECIVAVLAMITGDGYVQVKEELGPMLRPNGYYQDQADEYLINHGYAIARKYDTRPNGEKEKDWPTFIGEVHYASVASETGNHAVVMLPNGTVFDPLRTEPQKIENYIVHNIAAIYKVKA